jgi:hypothetical protein
MKNRHRQVYPNAAKGNKKEELARTKNGHYPKAGAANSNSLTRLLYFYSSKNFLIYISGNMIGHKVAVDPYYFFYSSPYLFLRVF